METLIYILESSLFKGICLFIVTLIGAFITEMLSLSDSAKEYTIGPILLENKVRYMVFDYTYLVTESIEKLTDTDSYEICYRAKPKLFAHILQRFSSHAARLGLSNIELK